jgi:uncharacterized protein YggE
MINRKHLTVLGASAMAGALALTGCGAGSRPPSTVHPAPNQVVLTSTNPGSTATITTEGTGTVTGTPDTATIGLGVSTTAGHAAQALQQNNVLTKRVQDVLRADGVAAKDIQTTGLSLQQNWTAAGPQGYGVYDEVTATLRSLATAGKTIDDAVGAAGDAGRLEMVNLSLGDSSPLMAAARQQAVANAKVQAQQLATAAGEQLGALVSLNDQPQQQGSLPYGLQGVAASATAAPVPLQPGSQQLSVQVVGVWQVLPLHG